MRFESAECALAWLDSVKGSLDHKIEVEPGRDGVEAYLRHTNLRALATYGSRLAGALRESARSHAIVEACDGLKRSLDEEGPRTLRSG